MSDGMGAGELLFICSIPFCWMIWIVLGFVIGQFAKGRGWAGAGLGFALGPIGLALIAVLGDYRIPPRYCEHCRGVVPWEATKCKHCASDLAPARPPQRPGAPPHSGPAAVASRPTAKPAPAPQAPIIKPESGKQFKCKKCNVAVIEEVELGEKVFVCPQCGNRWREQQGKA